MSPAENSEAIEVPFTYRTGVGPEKHLLHIADRFEANTVLCSFNTIQPSSFKKINSVKNPQIVMIFTRATLC